MIEIYRLRNGRYKLVAEVYEYDASVVGTSYFASWLEGAFEELREYGHEPADHMDKVAAKLKEEYNNGYYLVND